MITLLFRRLLNGYYFRRMRHGAEHAAWRVHTDALDAKIARRNESARDARSTEEHVRKIPAQRANTRVTEKPERDDMPLAELKRVHNTKVIARETPGVERKVKTR
jgi:hypothetical protein